MDDYLSRRIVTNTLKPPFEVMCRANSPSVGVAADGVYMAARVSTRSVGSYPAFPPLPETEASGGIFLLHLSEGHPWRALPVILALWSPDFPHVQAFALHPRPLGLLTGHILSKSVH